MASLQTTPPSQTRPFATEYSESLGFEGLRRLLLTAAQPMGVLSRAATFLVCLWLLQSLAAPVAAAHPLGNFTVNHYSRIEVSGDALAVRYVLDLAEIPSIQETRAADTDGVGVVTNTEWDAYKERKAADITSALELSIDNRRIPLQPTDVTVSQPLGQGDIPLVRLEMWLRPTVALTPGVEHQAVFRDRSDPARLGWREVVLHGGPGATISGADVPAQDVTDELRSYPDDLLQNPLDRREAHWAFTMDGNTTSATPATVSAAASRPTDPLAALVTATDMSPSVIVLALLAAAALGGVHAASPGHGKSIMAAYLVGRHGTVLDASALAVSVTLAHTTGVLVLGVLTVAASNLIVPEQLYPWLTLISGALVLAVGARFLVDALRGRTAQEHAHEHKHGHHGEHAHHADHLDGALAPTWRGLFALGLAGGIIPSGSALVVLLSSIALGRLGFGLVLILAFGLGMAIVLVATGVLLVHAGRFMIGFVPDTRRARLASLIPLVSASVMTLLGVVATVDGLSQTRLLGS
ncbi:MAG: sulfite exporter TauE/SafE family protein [Chloroflexi bacterium]|nr:sulfite exporter TauE/SafE family protein [Chloroflexota bacterium]